MLKITYNGSEYCATDIVDLLDKIREEYYCKGYECGYNDAESNSYTED